MAAFILCAPHRVPRDAVLSFVVPPLTGFHVCGEAIGLQHEVVLSQYNLQSPHCTLFWDTDHHRGSIVIEEGELHAVCLVNGTIVKGSSVIVPGDRVCFGGTVVYRVAECAADEWTNEATADAWADAMLEVLKFRGDVVARSQWSDVSDALDHAKQRLADVARVPHPVVVQCNAAASITGKTVKRIAWQLTKDAATELTCKKASLTIAWDDNYGGFVATSARNRLPLTHGVKFRLEDAEYVYCDEDRRDTHASRRGSSQPHDGTSGDSSSSTSSDMASLARVVHHLQFTAQALLQTLPVDHTNTGVTASLHEMRDTSILEQPSILAAQQQIEKSISALQLYAHQLGKAGGHSSSGSAPNTVRMLVTPSTSAKRFDPDRLYALVGRTLTSSPRDAQQVQERVTADANRETDVKVVKHVIHLLHTIVSRTPSSSSAAPTRSALWNVLFHIEYVYARQLFTDEILALAAEALPLLETSLHATMKRTTTATTPTTVRAQRSRSPSSVTTDRSRSPNARPLSRQRSSTPSTPSPAVGQLRSRTPPVPNARRELPSLKPLS